MKAPVLHRCGDQAALANVAVAPGSDCLCCLFDGSSAWLGWMPTLLVPSRVPVCQLVLCCSLAVPACLWPFISAHRQPVWSLLYKTPSDRFVRPFWKFSTRAPKGVYIHRTKHGAYVMPHYIRAQTKSPPYERCMDLCQVVTSHNAHCRLAADALNCLSKHLDVM